MFTGKEEAYAYMYKSSYKRGEAYKEHFVYELEDSRALLMKRTNNTKTSTRTYGSKLIRRDGKVYYKDGWFKNMLSMVQLILIRYLSPKESGLVLLTTHLY